MIFNQKRQRTGVIGANGRRLVGGTTIGGGVAVEEGDG